MTDTRQPDSRTGEELLPCPAGHAEAAHAVCEIDDTRMVYCGHALGCGWRVSGFDTAEQAAAAWNVRTSAAIRPSSETYALNRNRASNAPGGMECAVCGSIFIGDESHDLCAVCAAGGPLNVAELQDTIARLQREAEGLRRERDEARRDNPPLPWHALVGCKFPEFKTTWSDAEKLAWLDAFQKLVASTHPDSETQGP